MKLSDNKILFYSLLLAVIILSVIPLARVLGYFIIPGQEAYYHLRMADHIAVSGIPSVDPFTNNPYVLNPYHLLLAYSGNPLLASWILPFFLGILTIFLLNKILSLNPLDKAITFGILLVSPPFIFVFSTSNAFALPFFLITLCLFLFLKSNNFSYLSLPVFLTLPFFNLLIPLFGLAVLLSFTLNNKKKRKLFYIIFGLSIPLLFFSPGLPNNLDSPAILINAISDLGGLVGFGIFSIILSLLGLYLFWKKKKQIIPYSLLSVFFVLSVFFPKINILLSPFIAFFSSLALLAIFNLEWDIKFMRSLTIGLLVLGLVFSGLSFLNESVSLQPDKPIINALTWLKEQPDGIVFSHHKNSFWIQFVANKPTFIDPFSPDSKLNQSFEIFYSRNLLSTNSLLSQNNVSYILIDPEMNNGLVWSEDQEGLLFLFRNHKTFKKLYASDGIEIWKVSP